PLPELCATVRHRGQWLTLTATPRSVTIHCREGLQPMARVAVNGTVVEVGVGEERRVELG
ncbi:MAG TPA: glycosyl hydrolase family 65 protein, partial [Gemmatimonadaceae bacterium]|nr:glycosyl hydrolase family 65 protein [Gemmatimonadaceae bacterium]